jgi:hypothetical protein
MAIMQALIFGAGLPEDEFYETKEDEFDPDNKPQISVIPVTPDSEQRFPPVSVPLLNIDQITIDGALTVEMWGGGGSSGATREGRSGSGGAGGYSKIIIPTRTLGNYTNGSLIVRVGGGGGGNISTTATGPTPYALPFDEYLGDDRLNIAPIQAVATAQISNEVTLGNIQSIGESTSVSARTVGSISPVSQASGSAITSLTLSAPLQVGDYLFVASSADDGDFNVIPGFTTIDSNLALPDTSPGPGTPDPIAPGTFNGPSYLLQYKVIAATDTALLTSPTILSPLDATTTTGKTASHIAYAFRGVSATNGFFTQGTATNTTNKTNNIPLPNFTADINECTLLSFGFLDDTNLGSFSSTIGGYNVGPIASSNNSPAGIVRKTGITIDGVGVSTFIQDQDASGTPVTFDIGGLAAGDFVLVAAVSDGQAPNTFGPGFTEFATPPLSSPNVRYGYTFAAGTTVTVENTDNAFGGNDNIAYSVLVFTGVDEECPLDVNRTNDDGFGFPNPPNITPITDGCMLVALGFLDDDVVDPANVSAPAGFTLGPISATDQTGGDSSSVSTAYRLLTAGANTTQTVGTFTSTDSNDDDAWISYTLALRPKRIDSSVFAAYRTGFSGQNLSGGSFVTTATEKATSAGISIILRPTESFTGSTSMSYPAGVVAGDMVITASVSDGGTMNIPSGGGWSTIIQNNANPSIQLSYKFYDPVTDGTLINGLSATGNKNGNPLGITGTASARHVAYAYRNVNSSTLFPVLFSVLQSGSSASPDPTSFDVPDSSNYASIPFLFIGNKSLPSASITQPTTYTKGTAYATGSNSTGFNEATVINAIKNLPNENEDNPSPFNLPGVNSYKLITLGLVPSATAGSFTGELLIPGYTSQSGDLIISTSVTDNGEPAIPTRQGPSPTSYVQLARQNGNGANPGYQLSYRFTAAGETGVSNLSTNFGNRGTAHFVQVFRGVSPVSPIVTSDNGSGTTITFADASTVRPDELIATVSFVDDKNVTATGPADYITPIATSVGTGVDSTEGGTILFNYNGVPSVPLETPGNLSISEGDNWDSFTIRLSPRITNRFQGSINQAYGGSSGGYTAIYDGLTGDLLACVGGGGGGGGGTFGNPVFAPVNSQQYLTPNCKAGNGGNGGGVNQSGTNGTDGDAYIVTNPTFSSAIGGIGGGGGTLTSGGAGGQAYSVNYVTVPPTRTNIAILNPGESGVDINTTTSGGRGANSPYNNAEIPLQGANATGGFIGGRAGGATRSRTPFRNPGTGRDCGGAGGAGYFGGGGGGVGSYGGGGGGGGGSGYAAPGVIVLESSSGIGTQPGGILSPFWNGNGLGGSQVSGSTIPGTGGPGTPYIQANPGTNGRVVITYLSL